MSNKKDLKNSNPLTHFCHRQSGFNPLKFRQTLLVPSTFRQNLFESRLSVAKNLFKKDLVSHFGCVNAVEFSKEGNYLISGGDDRRVLLWNLEKSILEKQEPRAMEKQHLSNIFCLSFNNQNTRIFSGGNDDTVIVHDVITGDPVDVFFHAKPVYGLSVDPNNEQLFSTAGEDGRVLMFDLRTSLEVMCIVKYRAPFHAVMFHPIDDSFVITANAKEGAALWDLRTQKMPIIRYGGENAAQSCMSVRFNTMGDKVLALRRRLPPILFKTLQQDPVCQFYHPDYYNSCTMKSCSFAGERDEFVLSGSDDFNLYVWRVADADLEMTNQWVDHTQMVLYGHRSIVNQVRYNPQKCLIASSGVEKVIKLWSPFEMEDWTGNLIEEAQGPENPREVFTHEEYISLVHYNGQNMTHDYSNQNTNEDPRMMAFFDYLVQQEIEGWNSESSESSDHSSENSSRPDSQTSDTEPTSFTQTTPTASTSRVGREVKRGDSAVLQRNKYRNRIAFLIATKRKSLKRLALKRVPRQAARRMKGKYLSTRQQVKRNPLRTTRKPYDKKIRRLSVSKYKKPVSHEQTSDSEVPQKIKKRRIQQHLNTSSYRSFRRKVKTPLSSTSNTSTRAADKSDSSSDDDDDDTRNLPSTSTSHHNNHNNRHNSAAPLDINMPSTSTGITANGKSFLFRITSNQNDSDDDQSIPENVSTANDNLLRVIRSPPINSLHSLNYSAVGGSDDDDDDEVTVGGPQYPQLNDNHLYYSNNNNNNHQHHPTTSSRSEPPQIQIPQQQQNGQKKPNRNEDEESSSSFTRADDYACSSNSNSRLSSSYLEDCSSSQDSFMEYYSNKKRKLMHQSSSNDESNNNNNSNNLNNNGNFNNNNNNNFLNNNIVNEGASGSSYRLSLNGNGTMLEASTSSTSFETPNSKVKTNNHTPDSGVSINAPGSSSSSHFANGFSSVNNRNSHNNNQQNSTSKSSSNYEKMKKLEKIKRNFNDDDSD